MQPSVGTDPKALKVCTQRRICTPISIAVFTRAKRWKQPKPASKDEQIHTMRSIHTRETYSALKRKKILSHGTTWMNLVKDIMLSEISPQKDKDQVVPLRWRPKVSKFTDTERMREREEGKPLNECGGPGDLSPNAVATPTSTELHTLTQLGCKCNALFSTIKGKTFNDQVQWPKEKKRGRPERSISGGRLN